MNNLVKIKTAGKDFFDVDEDLKLIDFAYFLHTSRKRFLKKWIKEHQMIKFDEEEIIYIHRYPKDKETVIGIMRMKQLDYFI